MCKHALAHGFDEAQVATEGVPVVRKPRWVTALGCLRYSDLFASGTCFLLILVLLSFIMHACMLT